MKKILPVLTGIVLSITAFLIVLELLALSPSFYNSGFQKYSELRLSDSDFTLASDRIVDYINGQTEDIQFHVTIDGASVQLLNDKEITHLTDIRGIAAAYKNIVHLLEIILVVLIVLQSALNKKNPLKPFLFSAITAIVLLIGLAILYQVDFQGAFFKLHELLFTNDLWLLDPRTDRLIQMMPLDFFKRFTLYWIGITVGLHALLLVLYLGTQNVLKKRMLKD